MRGGYASSLFMQHKDKIKQGQSPPNTGTPISDPHLYFMSEKEFYAVNSISSPGHGIVGMHSRA